jgi:hypothetical protein
MEADSHVRSINPRVDFDLEPPDGAIHPELIVEGLLGAEGELPIVHDRVSAPTQEQ